MMKMQKPRIRYSIIIPTHNRVASLQRCIESLLHQDVDRETYEIIVVNDGSTDGTASYLQSLSPDVSIRSITIPNSGPSLARNRGAQIAFGDILVFTDDDCTHPRTWLRDVDSVLTAKRAVAVGGSVQNRIPDNDLTAVYEETTRFFARRMNRKEGKALFLTTNNFAVLRSVFQKYGGFDERFYLGAMDREFATRLVAAGEVVYYAPEIVVEHYHHFSLKSLFLHLFRQGRGSYLFYIVIGYEKQFQMRPLPWREYLRLLREVSRAPSLSHRLKRASIALFVQVVVALGYLSALWEGITNLQSEQSEKAQMVASGKRGTAFGLLSFLGGTAFSSVFGFFSFLLIANALSIPDFGIFMVAFSLESIVSTIGNGGLPLSVTRYASEFSKRGDEIYASSILKTGFFIQILITLILVAPGRFLLEPTVSAVLTVTLPEELYTAVLVGSAGSILYNYTTAVYSTYLRFLNLAFLRSVVSVIRFSIILGLASASSAGSVAFFWAFIIPHWLGFAVAFVALQRQVHHKGFVRLSYAKEILTYGGWNTISSVARLLTTHLGSLILAAYTTEREVGIYGLGRTLSFVYGVVSSTISQYFMPIGARVKSNADIMPFVRRVMRLVLPLFLLSFISLAFAKPIIGMVYGESRLVAIPTFILLSLPVIVSMAMVPVNVLFHYFFKPYLISLENVLRLGMFLIGALWLAPSTGATGVAAALCVAGMLVHIFSFVLLAWEFKKRGLSFEPLIWRSFGFTAER